MFFCFLSFLFHGLFCLWIVYLLSAVLSAGFLYFVVCRFVSRCRFRIFRSVTCFSRVSFSSCNFFIGFTLFSFSMFEFLVCCRFYLFLFRWGTHFYMSLFPSVHPSVCPSVVHHISGTVHHVIIIFGTHV